MRYKGDKIGNYILINKIGRGGYGEVWLAEKRTTLVTTKFALKLPNDEIDLEIIRTEADVWCSVSGHPNVLPIIEADIYDDQIVIASEYVQGGSLADWIKVQNDKASSIDSTIQIIRCVLDGLEFLHSKNVIHRDLKPENILLQEGIPRLTDFGISKIFRSENTSTKQISGTIAYMPPEAFEGKYSFQTDLWSVGVISYQMLTGHLPFERPDQLSIMKAIATDPPAELPLEFPLSWREFIAKSLAKDKNLRFQTANEMKRTWEAVTHEEFANKNKLEITSFENTTKILPTENLQESLTMQMQSPTSILKEHKTINQEALATESHQSFMKSKTAFVSLWNTSSGWITIGILMLIFGISITALLKYQNAQLNKQTSNNFLEENASVSKPSSVKKYLEMSENEKQQFVSAEADKILLVIQEEPKSKITLTGKENIKQYVDSYVRRRFYEHKDSCGGQTWFQSDLTTVLKRGIKIAPDITKGFKEKNISPIVGIYLAMNESEFCPCMRAPTGALGVYQFSTQTAIDYGLKAFKGATADNPDERCNAEPASQAAAAYVKKLIAEDFGTGANQIVFAIASYNSGESGLRQNIETAKKLLAIDNINYWTLLENKDKMSDQFQSENCKYVTKFFASAIVGENPRVFDVDVEPLSSYVK